MTPSKLPSFKHNEYVHKWLKTAQAESEPLETSKGQGRAQHENEKRSRSTASSPGHRGKRRRSEHQDRGHKVADIEPQRAPRKRQSNTNSSPPAPVLPEHATTDRRRYLDRIVQEGAIATERGTQAAALINPVVGTDLPKTSRKHGKHQGHDPAPVLGHDPSLKYARRPRHKTREDRYEYKGYEDARKVQKITGHNKRSARRKSGAALNEEFQAPNVDSERLTLKQPSGPGFLSKGKSSDPATRRGIPDLTFSEMTFLNKRRDLDDARFRGYAAQENKRKAPKGNAPDISEYFAPPAEPAAEAIAGQRDLRGGAEVLKDSGYRGPPLRSARRQAMSEMSQNRYDVNTRSVDQSRGASSAKTWHPDPYETRLQHFGTGDDIVGIELAIEQATSYISWSPSIANQHGRQQREDLSETSMLRRDDALAAVEKDRSRYAAHTVYPHSSVSNVSRVRKLHSPSGRYAHGPAVATTRSQRKPAKVYYSLDDLKSIAKDSGGATCELGHNDLPLRALRPLQRPRSRDSYLDPPKQHDAPDLMAFNDRVDLRTATSKLASDRSWAVSETGHARDFSVSRRDGVTDEEYHATTFQSSPRIRSSARVHGLSSARPALWKQPLLTLAYPGLRRPGSGLKADMQSNLEPCLYTHGSSPDLEAHIDPMDRPYVCPGQQHAASHDHEPVAREDRLDAFDAELLQTLHDPTLDVESCNAGLGPSVTPTCGRRIPAATYDHRALSSYEADQLQQGLQAISSENCDGPNCVDVEEHSRPQLLRPSEAQILAPKPFTGFSRPCILY